MSYPDRFESGYIKYIAIRAVPAGPAKAGPFLSHMLRLPGTRRGQRPFLLTHALSCVQRISISMANFSFLMQLYVTFIDCSLQI